MKVYNKFVHSIKEPSNKSDIWFDGSYWRMYTGGQWTPFTISTKVAKKVEEYANNLKLFNIVDVLPEKGVEDIIYLLIDSTGENTTLIQYTYINNSWEELGSFTINVSLEDYVKKEEIPFEKGKAENSAVLKGEYEGYSNKAISQTSMAIGAATTAGIKGWYYSAIDFTNKKITLSDKPTYILVGTTLINGGWSSGTPNIKVNDVISLVNNSKYDLCSKVTAIKDNVITVDSLPFTELVVDSGASLAVLARQFSDGYSVYIPDRPDAGIIDFGGGAFSEGGQSKASNICAHAEGLQTHAYGQYSHAEGRETKAGYGAHAEGRATEAIGTMSHAEGQSTLAIGSKSHAEGTQTETHANNSHSEGYKTIVKDGAGAHAEGYGSVIDFTESTNSIDIPVDANKNQSIGAHIEGVNNRGAGIAIHVEGKNNRVNGLGSHAEGGNTRAGVYDAPTENVTSTEGIFAHAEGNSTLARGSASHAEGAGTQALARAAHAEGRHSIAAGNYSHAEGFDTFAGDNGGKLSSTTKNETIGFFSHAEGHNTLAEGNSSHAEGKGTKALNVAEHASGKFNVSTKSSDASQATHFSIGIGTSDTKRKNAVEVKQNGDVYITGIGGFTGANSNSSKSVQEVINELVDIINQITTSETN